MTISIDRQLTTRKCDSCNAEYTVIRGSAYDNEQPFGLYLIGLHGHAHEDGRLAHFAIAVLDETDGTPNPSAVAIRMFSTDDEYCMTFEDWSESPWKNETYLGKMMDRVEALQCPFKGRFFEIANEVTEANPEVEAYYASD